MEFTVSTRRRLIAALRKLALSEQAGAQQVWLTLTTTLKEPKNAKKWLKTWIDSMRYHHRFTGVYCLEFQNNGNVHFHFALRFKDGVETDTLRHECFARWETCTKGTFDRKGGDMGLIDSWPKTIVYMAKYDPEKRELHPKAWEKALPPILQERGLGTNFWGKINCGNMAANKSKVARFPEIPMLAA